MFRAGLIFLGGLGNVFFSKKVYGEAIGVGKEEGETVVNF